MRLVIINLECNNGGIFNLPCFRMRSLCPKTLDHLRGHQLFLVRKLFYFEILYMQVSSFYWFSFAFDEKNSTSNKCPVIFICNFLLLQGGLSGIGLGLGPGGQPIDANQLNRGGGGMGNMGPGGNHSETSKTLEFLQLK